MLPRKNTLISALMLTGAFFLSACIFQVDPSLLTQDASTEDIDISDNASAAEISAEMPYETQFVEVNG